MVTDQIFPKFQLYTRDFAHRTALMPEFVAKEYAQAIYRAGLTNDQIKNGVRQFERGAADKPWMPNPAEFVEMCRDAIVAGAPDARDAYQEACRSAGFLSEANWSHPAVYVAGKAAGWFNLRNKPEKETWPVFKQCYKDALARVAAGEDLAAYVPVAAIEQRSVFKADLDTPGRVKALQMISRLNKSAQ